MDGVARLFATRNYFENFKNLSPFCRMLQPKIIPTPLKNSLNHLISRWTNYEYHLKVLFSKTQVLAHYIFQWFRALSWWTFETVNCLPGLNLRRSKKLHLSTEPVFCQRPVISWAFLFVFVQSFHFFAISVNWFSVEYLCKSCLFEYL